MRNKHQNQKTHRRLSAGSQGEGCLGVPVQEVNDEVDGERRIGNIVVLGGDLGVGR